MEATKEEALSKLVALAVYKFGAQGLLVFSQADIEAYEGKYPNGAKASWDLRETGAVTRLEKVTA